MTELGAAKQVVLDYYRDFDHAGPGEYEGVLRRHAAPGYSWRGLFPFHELGGVDAVAERFWEPFVASFGTPQRRPDIFIAGRNDCDGGETIWVCQMGHLLGLFDQPWLGIAPTRRMLFFRYAEFHRIEAGHIAETALFFDLLSVMQQAGCSPLPPQTGAAFVHPGPLTHDGLLLDDQDPARGAATMALVNEMVADLEALNRRAAETGLDDCPPEVLARTWRDDMIWFGPAGIGSSFTIPRYQEQHQRPFREGLGDKEFLGHVARFAEGDYAGFFGWPNLTNRNRGGFLGLPEGAHAAPMRVVDMYRRDGDRLAENWVFIDLANWLAEQGHDVLARVQEAMP